MVSTNPNIFRASNLNNNWASKYIEKKSIEFALYSIKDQEIQKFIIKFFKSKGLNVHTCNLNYINNTLNVFVSYQKNSTISFLLKKTNTAQKIKLKRRRIRGRFKIRKKVIKKSENFKRVMHAIKNYCEYGIFKNKQKIFKSKKLLLKILKKKRRRIKWLRYYKKHLSLKENVTEHNVRINNPLNGLFQSLNIFLKKPLDITLVMLPLNSNTKKILTKEQFKILKRKYINFKRHTRNPYFRDGVNLLPALLTQRNSAELLAKFIAISLKKQKRHNFFLRFIKNTLKILTGDSIYSPIKGIQIKVKGRINGAPRARWRRIRIGREIPNSTISSKINYFEAVSYTLNGTMSIKVWVYEKNENLC